MLIKGFKGRAILPASLKGEAVVSKTGFNAYASFFNSLHEGAVAAECADSSNKDLFGKRLDGKIICLPNTIGSTSAGAVWQRIVQLGVAPLAMLFSKPIDSLAAGGLIVADLWAGKRIVTIDQLGDEFLRTISEGDWITLQEDGLVIIN
jgi:predicted aconitase with swiveling domain